MGVVKPTGASHKAEISQYLCGFSISVYSFYHPSAQKNNNNKKTFVIHQIVTASFSLSVFLPLCGGGGRSAGGCASLNPLIINALVDIWYHISTSFPLKRHPLGKKKTIWIWNLKWDQFYWPTSLIHSLSCWPKKPRKLVTYNPSKTLPPHSLLCCPQPGCPSSAVPHKTPFNKTLFSAVKQRDARPFQSTAALPSPPWSRAAVLPYFPSSLVELWPSFPGCMCVRKPVIGCIKRKKAPSCHFI